MPVKHKPLITGDVFGEWTVLRFSEQRNGDFRYLAQCTCGTQREVSARNLRLGHSRSCGCKKIDLMVAKVTKHGMHQSSTYKIWTAMLDRCRNPNHPSFPDYGGRGITVHPEWSDFRVFLRDMGEKPSGLSLDRIDNSKGYTPNNCRWATPKTQMRNTRRNRIVRLYGAEMCLTDAAHKLGIDPPNVWNRARYHGISLQEALDHFVTSQLPS